MLSLNSYRKHDPVIYICQNNQNRSVEITALNPEAEKIVGYSANELVSKSLSTILPARINDAVDDMVEFKGGARDVSDALLKCRDFGIVNKSGKDVPCKMRIVRCAPIDHNELFQIILVKEEAVRENKAFREMLSQNFKGHEIVDNQTGIPNRTSLIKDLELTHFHSNNNKLIATLAVIHIDKFDQCRQDFGDEIAFGLYKHVAGICRRTLRSLDTLSMADNFALGCILMDTNRESARMACNRLRWTIAASPMVLASGLQIPTTISIAYTEIANVSQAVELLETCEKKIASLREDSMTNNSLNYVVSHDKRAGSDRRSKNVGRIGPDRRKAERRTKE